MNAGRLIRISKAWFRLLLRFYPPNFRDEMGNALVETYQDRVREALDSGRLSRVASVWWAALRDSLRNGLGEHVSPAVSWRRAGDWGRDFEKVGRRFLQKPAFLIAVVSLIFTRPGYISAMGMRLLAGRDFNLTHSEGVREAIIDRHLAEEFFPNRSPLGATLRHAGKPTTIVGVVDQARLYNLHEDDKYPQVFVRAQDYEGAGYRPSWIVVRSDRDPLILMSEVRTAIRRVDRRPPVSHVRTMEQIVADRRSRERISAVLLAGLAIGTLLLIAMGLFGMISGSVAQRRAELAVRLVLGATHGRVIRLVVGEGLRLVALGLLLGIPGIYMSGQAIRGLLIGISPFDTTTLVVVALGLFAVALTACYLAARRITTIEPERLLREG